MSNFDYSQKFSRRVINDPRLKRFIWDFHNFGTTYVEPFVHASIGPEGTQNFVPYSSVKPVRNISLDFPLLLLQEEDHAVLTGLAYRPELDFNKLKDFYMEHKSYKPFIYEHPIYGDMTVRFSKPIAMPKKIKGGVGVVQNFTVELQEVVTTDYTFQKGENYQGDIDFPVGYYDVEIDYPDNSNLIPLGNNYTMAFYSVAKNLRVFKLTCSGLKYCIDFNNQIRLDYCPDQNMALLEMFYLKYRLNSRFNFEYMGEVIPVRFQQPISIPKINGNTGIISDLELTLIETPYKTSEKGTVYERGDKLS